MRPELLQTIRQYNFLFRDIQAAYHTIAEKMGLSDSQLAILYILRCMDGQCLLRDLIHMTGMPKQTIHSCLQQMKKDGIVTIDMVDKKSKTVFLTAQGKNWSDRYAAPILELEANIYASWQPEEIQTYLDLTHKYLVMLKTYISEDME